MAQASKNKKKNWKMPFVKSELSIRQTFGADSNGNDQMGGGNPDMGQGQGKNPPMS